MKALQIKKKHHYVWAYYLKGWANDGTNVWYLSKKGNPSFDSIRGIGCENNFYKVGLLRSEDIELIHLWIKDSSPELRLFFLEMVEVVKRLQMKSNYFQNSFFSKHNVDINEVVASNMFENFMSMQENSTLAVLRSLREGMISCLNEQKAFWDFSYYLGNQFSRTKRMRDALLYSIKNSPLEENIKKRWAEFYTNHWWFMCSYFGANFAKDIALNRDGEVKLITNCTDELFITTDQPVINLNPQGQAGACVDYYYPLSDKRALLISNSGLISLDDSLTDIDTVVYLNEMMAGFAGDTIFASDKNALLKYKKAFNKREFKFF